MKKGLIITATTLLLLSGCTEDKQEQKVEQSTKTQVKQEVNVAVEQEKEKIVEEVKKIEEKSTDTQQEKKEEAKIDLKVEDTNLADAETMFKTCASCHGTKGEKEALGKSQAIAGWDKDRTIKALNGYKDGTYGGVMKGIMKPHVETKTPEQIDVLADFISKL
ncbi:c-type cytochrome [Aliarcobacter vitoriensis]|uniref:Cytochrome C n=1 Tax=Aliarcobacter vitoriensis TaxID=2011099 RepID=A0A366MRQ2_9BACT|nr:c-type cytochrome [Aliarcobacter vitoriensis]RBQ28274.1 cytochrome C [Aliarcobacter vitoriensis]